MAEAELVADDSDDGDADAWADGVGEADFDADAELDADADADDEADAVGDADFEGEGRAGLLVVGLLIGLLAEADVVGVALTDGVGLGEGVVVRVGLGVGVGEGDAVLADGGTWQFRLALAEAVRLGVALTGFREPACAVPDQAASAPRITEPPARKLSAVARMCVKRTDTNLSK